MSTPTIDENALRGRVRKLVAKHGAKSRLCNEAQVQSSNLTKWLNKSEGILSAEALSRIESALTKLTANGGKKQ